VKFLNKENSIYAFVIILITYFFWEIDAKYGFVPRDEARVLGMVQRISNGEVPHRDFMYQTLIGSPYLHIFHLLIPTMNLQFQRIVSILMFQIYSLALLSLSDNFRKSALHLKVLLFIISSILNMHFFEFTIWPTVDGIFTLSIGSFLIFKSNKYQYIGFFIIGLSPLMKTPYFISVFFITLFATIIIDRFTLKDFVFKSLTAASPTVIYIIFVSVNGGLQNLIEETLNQPSNSFELVNSWIHHLGFYEKRLIPLSILLVLLFTYKAKTFKTSLIVSSFSFIAIVLLVNFLDFTSMTYKPIINLLNLFFIFILFLKYRNNRFPDTFVPFFICYSIEFAAIMSIGYRWGLFVSGTVIVLILLTTIDIGYISKNISDKSKYIRTTSIYSLLILIMFAVPLKDSISFKSEYIYMDKDKDNLVFNLNNLHPKYGNVYTSDTVYAYLQSIQNCLARYDTKKVSIFPDNPLLYFIYDLENPIPVDWYTAGVEGKVDFDDVRIKEKMKSKDYSNSIVMLQSYKVSKLTDLKIDEVNILIEDPFPDYVQNFYKDVYSYLGDRRNTKVETCNSFTVLINN